MTEQQKRDDEEIGLVQANLDFVDTSMLVKFGLTTIIMLALIVVKFSHFIIQLANEEVVLTLLIALSMLPAFILGWHQLYMLQVVWNEPADQIYLNLNHGKLVWRVLRTTIALLYIIGFVAVAFIATVAEYVESEIVIAYLPTAISSTMYLAQQKILSNSFKDQD